MCEVAYDREMDTLVVIFSDAHVAERDEDKLLIILATVHPTIWHRRKSCVHLNE